MGVFRLGSYVIGSDEIGNADLDRAFVAPVGVPSKDVEIDAGQKISACWYVPVDNIPSLVSFRELIVEPDNHPYYVKLRFSVGGSARLRINIFCQTA